jgi:hypothetical protein
MESIYNNWDDAAEATLRRMVVVASNSPRDRNMFDPIEKYLSQWIIRLQGGDFHESDVDLAVDILFRAGVTSLQEMTQHQSFSESDMLDLLVRKQHDYGHDNINNFGIIGIAIRMCDKIARIKNLSNRDTEGLNEPLHDSYLDIVGYAVIASMYHDGSFQLQLERDTK